jgi:Predicted transcriptional regulators
VELFAARLKWCRERRSLTQKQMAEKIGMTQSSYSKYEYNLREPKLEILAQLPAILDESLDFLLGVTDFTKNATIISNKYDEACMAVAVVESEKEKALWNQRREAARTLLYNILSEIPFVKETTLNFAQEGDEWISLLTEVNELENKDKQN